MDDRAQQPPHVHHLASQLGSSGGATSAPWPGYAPPVVDAPISGHAPYPGPTMQQFHYSDSGFVLPGAPAEHQQPFAAHGGVIGQSASPAAGSTHMLPLLDAGAQHEHGYAVNPPAPRTQQSIMMESLGIDPSAQQQSWAFPTPYGMQLVQPGPGQMHVSAHAAEPAPLHAPVHARAARRVRWETIIPAFAVVCLFAAAGLFFSDFDRMTGRSAGASSSAARAAEQNPVSAVDPTAPATSQRAAAPSAAVRAAQARRAALLNRMNRARAAGQWTLVIATINTLEQIRPLPRSLVQLRVRARAAYNAAQSRQLARARSAARPSAQASTSGRASNAPPAAGGGASSGSTSARPPASVAAGAMPPRPDLPNPTGSPGSVAGGGPGAMSAADHAAMS